jgi:hypothetical protein
MLKVSDLLKKHRAELGTRNGTRALTCWQQAKFLPAWFRDIPVRKPGKGDLDTDAKCRRILLRGLRYQGERGFALLKERWRALQHVTVSPTQIGDIVKAALVLTQIEHKMIA